jgi:hypothetical protein
MRRGPLAEFDDPKRMLWAIRELQARGHVVHDAFGPYPVPGALEALALPRSNATWIVLPFALMGVVVGYVVQWFCNAFDYPLNAGGRPPHAVATNIPITFETLVLFTALGAFFVLMAACNLPELWSPIFEVPGFHRASIDRFFVWLDDEKLPDRTETRRLLEELGALRVEWLP